MVYLLTWSCYGARVPGDEGTIAKRTNQVGAPRQSASESLRNKSRALMLAAPWHPAEPERQIVLQAIAEVCQYRNWTLLAAHFRDTHIHAAVESESKPELILHDFKAYSTRALNRSQVPRRYWSRHGSTVYLWTPEQVSNAVRYIIENQGDPMALLVPSITVGAR
jgi:REP element-mobilizing transposase RayT